MKGVVKILVEPGNRQLYVWLFRNSLSVLNLRLDQVANMLYIDNPVGSGLSYSLNSSDYNTTDTQERLDLEQTVRQWFQQYPYFQSHDVFYTGKILMNDPLALHWR